MGSRKKQMAEAIKAEKKQVAFAKLNNCPTSPRKMRLVADLVRGQKAEKALKETGCDGIMIGRAAQGNPWIFKQILLKNVF